MGDRVLLRADGGPHIGMGHVMRCFAMAEGLVGEGFEPLVALRGYDANLASVVVVDSIATEFLPADLTIKQDADFTMQLASGFAASALVVDVCHSINMARRTELNNYLAALRKTYFSVCFTGNSEMNFPADMIISPYFRSSLPNPDETNCGSYLLGPRYFVFRQEFLQHNNTQLGPIGDVRRILVSIGGGDRCELTLKAASAFALDRQHGTVLRFIIGPTYPVEIEKKVRVLLEDANATFEICCGSSDMAEDLAWADLAILGDGLVKYEAALVGTPCITLARPDSDEVMNQEFACAGSSVHLGDGTKLSADSLAREIKQVCGDSVLREMMATRGRDLLDHLGAKRIASAIRASPAYGSQ